MLKKMRQCRLNFAENRYDCEAGIIGEHYATELIVTPPVIMPSEAVYRLCFEPGGLSEIILQTTDGTFISFAVGGHGNILLRNAYRICRQ